MLELPSLRRAQSALQGMGFSRMNSSGKGGAELARKTSGTNDVLPLLQARRLDATGRVGSGLV